MRVVNMLDFRCQRSRVILADRFAVAFRELAGVGKRGPVCGVERGEFPLRGFAVGERGGVRLLVALVLCIGERDDYRRCQRSHHNERTECDP